MKIKYDVISQHESEYCHARIDSGGYIYIEGKMFHKGNKLQQFKAFTFRTLKAAKAMLPDDIESFIIEFQGKEACERLWFSREQREKGLVDRLDLWHQCYGGYPVSLFEKKVKYER